MSRNNCLAKRAKSKPWFQRPIFLPISLRRSAADSVAGSVGTAWYVVDMRFTPFKCLQQSPGHLCCCIASQAAEYAGRQFAFQPGLDLPFLSPQSEVCAADS